jgi:gamma-glutamyltranspeptidase/glutathione hydrolase
VSEGVGVESGQKGEKQKALHERGGQGELEEGSPNFIRPGKRPRLTPNPTLILKNGQPYLALGTPGNDRQPQAMLQALLNLEVFGMDIQQAINAPRFRTMSMPATFAPHEPHQGRFCWRGSCMTRRRRG